jgi:hypothetical protein
LKNYENRLKAIKRLADSKTAKVVILDYKDGKYFLDGKQVDINTFKADAIIIDDIPSDEDLAVSSAPPESLKGSDIGNENNG